MPRAKLSRAGQIKPLDGRGGEMAGELRRLLWVLQGHVLLSCVGHQKGPLALQADFKVERLPLKS